MILIKNDNIKPIIQKQHKHKKIKKNINAPKIKFNNVLSTNKNSWYGVIWNCLYGTDQCITKMVLLKEGPWRNRKYFTKNDIDPFRHTEFYNKKPMVRNTFLSEISKQKILYDYGLAPKVHTCWINDTSFDIHYGFVVMEKMDCSLRDVLIQRNLTTKENELIDNLFYEMHEKHGIIHGDLKPANIGVYLDENQKIIKCLALDCTNVKFKDDLGDKFNNRVQGDLENYKQRVIEIVKRRQ